MRRALLLLPHLPALPSCTLVAVPSRLPQSDSESLTSIHLGGLPASFVVQDDEMRTLLRDLEHEKQTVTQQAAATMMLAEHFESTVAQLKQALQVRQSANRSIDSVSLAVCQVIGVSDSWQAGGSIGRSVNLSAQICVYVVVANATVFFGHVCCSHPQSQRLTLHVAVAAVLVVPRRRRINS